MKPPITPQTIILGTLGYLVITFPLAYVWHLVVFKQTYESLGYFSREEPIVASASVRYCCKAPCCQ